jgi:hypothetical protein
VHNRKKTSKLSSDGGDSGGKKCKEVMVESVFGGSLESGGRFCVAFGRNLASVAVKMFSHLISFIKKFYKFCNFNAIFKDNPAINCITFRHKKKGSFPSALTSHITLVIK